MDQQTATDIAYEVADEYGGLAVTSTAVFGSWSVTIRVTPSVRIVIAKGARARIDCPNNIDNGSRNQGERVLEAVRERLEAL